MTGTETLYHKVAEIAEDYFGPVADRFVVRIINSHLGKAPNKLVASDMPELVKWIRATMAVITDDENLINEFSERLTRLSTQTTQI